MLKKVDLKQNRSSMDESTIRILETLLKKAKEGEIAGGVFVVINKERDIFPMFNGGMFDSATLLGLCEVAKMSIISSMTTNSYQGEIK